MESDLEQNHENILQQHRQQQQMNSGLSRFRSAPSSYFANFLESENCEEFLNQRASSPETEQIISRFFSPSGGVDGGDDSSTQNLIGRNPQLEINQQNQFMSPMKFENETIQQLIYQSNKPPFQNSEASSSAAMDASFRVAASTGMDRFPQTKMDNGSNSNLLRHSSSPAGLFSNINIENGYVTMRDIGNFGGGSGNTTGDHAPFSSTTRLKNQMNYGSGPSSSSSLMSPIYELGNKNNETISPENENHSGNFITGFPIGSWDDSALMTENFSELKRARDDTLFPSEGDGSKPPHNRLSHHLSLPKTSVEIAAMEKLLQFQDSVPCKIRAKRGCATHPRSIAERVRRTRISERMRKLQELVPNMDKQTNTADMLDLAVDYIKDLQKEVQILANNRSKCTCSNKQKQ